MSRQNPVKNYQKKKWHGHSKHNNWNCLTRIKKNYILITHYSLKKLMTIEGQNDKNKMKKGRSIIDLERNNWHTHTINIEEIFLLYGYHHHY